MVEEANYATLKNLTDEDLELMEDEDSHYALVRQPDGKADEPEYSSLRYDIMFYTHFCTFYSIVLTYTHFYSILGCAGTCQNMLSCMFSGQKVDWDSNDACPGMVNSCCTAWTPRKKYFRNRIKSGRSLGLFSPQVQVNK